MRLSTFTVSIGVFFSLWLSSCQKDSDNDAGLKQLDIKMVAYGSDTAQNMDVYLPAGRDTANTKIVVFIHGGSWSSGDKNEFDEAIAAIRSELPDYALFNINYRLSFNGINRYPVQINDVQAALDLIAGKAGEYKINANKIALVGASAGAHLAMLQAYKNNATGKIKAVVDLFGPADLTDLYNNHPVPQSARFILQNFLGTTLAANATVYQQASPINYVSTQSVPTKIFHGDQDIVVPIAQSYALKAKLESMNVKVDMTVYTAEGHGWYGSNLLDTYDKSVDFIKENVQ